MSVEQPMKYGNLTFIKELEERAPDKRILGLWRCDCGKEYRAPIGRVKGGYLRSCGCLIGKSATHGRRGTPEYASWRAMKARCLNPDDKDYPRWGGRGIAVCAQWTTSFEAFFADLGPRPPGTTLDRIDNRKGYEPGNCRWATHAEQQSNRKDGWTVEIGGVRYNSAREAARAIGVSVTTIERWCDGYIDPRRPHITTPPKAGCSRWRTYAS